MRLNVTLCVHRLPCFEGTGLCCIDILSTVIGLYTVILCYKVGLHLETNILCTKNSSLRVDYITFDFNFWRAKFLVPTLSAFRICRYTYRVIQNFILSTFFVIQFVDMSQAFVSDNRLNYAPLNRIMPILPPPGREPRIIQHGTH
jgi:hypothetical protein